MALFSSWKQEIKTILLPKWWGRLLFFAWRRLSTVWKNPYFLLAVIWLQIICLWGGLSFTHVGCFCFEPAISLPMRLALGLVQIWYFYLLILLMRVSLYPAEINYIRLLEKERGLLWVLQLLVPLLFAVFLLDMPTIWPFFLVWAFIAADGQYLGAKFLWALPVCALSWVVAHLPFLLIFTVAASWLTYWLGNALVLYFFILPFFTALLSAAYTLWLEQK